jgi:hypothetical protein
MTGACDGIRILTVRSRHIARVAVQFARCHPVSIVRRPEQCAVPYKRRARRASMPVCATAPTDFARTTRLGTWFLARASQPWGGHNQSHESTHPARRACVRRSLILLGGLQPRRKRS